MITMSDEEQKGLTGFFSRFGSAKKQTVSEEEIKDIVADNDELADDEKRMIHDIIDLGDMSVHEIMQPRVDMIMVEDTETVRTAVERMHGTGYSRLPIFHEDADHIIGIVHYKNLVGPLIDGREDDLAAKYAFEPLFVPETKDIFPLLKEMQTNRQQMAIVVDEYGGTDGLITVEDIIEEIVGEIVDEYDMEGKEITKLSDGVWRVDGRFPVEDAAALGWPVSESEDYETIAGWLIDTLDFVPEMGDEFTVGGYSFKIERMRRSRISTIRVERLAGGADVAEEGEGQQEKDALGRKGRHRGRKEAHARCERAARRRVRGRCALLRHRPDRRAHPRCRGRAAHGRPSRRCLCGAHLRLAEIVGFRRRVRRPSGVGVLREIGPSIAARRPPKASGKPMWGRPFAPETAALVPLSVKFVLVQSKIENNNYQVR